MLGMIVMLSFTILTMLTIILIMNIFFINCFWFWLSNNLEPIILEFSDFISFEISHFLQWRVWITINIIALSIWFLLISWFVNSFLTLLIIISSLAISVSTFITSSILSVRFITIFVLYFLKLSWWSFFLICRSSLNWFLISRCLISICSLIICCSSFFSLNLNLFNFWNKLNCIYLSFRSLLSRLIKYNRYNCCNFLFFLLNCYYFLLNCNYFLFDIW